MSLQLEIGKTYRNRLGELVKISGPNSNNAMSYPFQDANGCTYTTDGTWSIIQGDTAMDLVEEIIDRKPCALFNGRRLRRLEV